MKLVAWNANYNGNRRSLEANMALLEPLCADVVVLSETAPPTTGNPLRAHWFGAASPGLAVVAAEGWNLVPHVANVGAPTLMAGFSLSGRACFELLAVWPVQRRGDPSYHSVLMQALERYAALLQSGRAVMAGDFNSSARVVSQRRSHPEFVAAAEAQGLASAYHALTSESHGEETAATYFHGAKAASEFHLDYCFVSRALVGSAKFCIEPAVEWRRYSDHLPVVLEIADEALTETGNGPRPVDAA